MATTSERTVVEIRGMVIDIRDDSTGEAIMEWWPTKATGQGEVGA